MVLLKTDLLTAPSVLWIHHRFLGIFRESHRAIRHHAKNDGRRMAIHIASGLVLLVAIPILALLLIPPASRPAWLTSGAGDRQDAFLLIVGAFLLTVNGSTMYLIPHPKRFREYRSRGLDARSFANAVSMLHAANWQFVSMTPSSLAVLAGEHALLLLGIGLFAAAWTLYLASTTLCLLELSGIAWEETAFAKEIVFPILPHGPRKRSNIVGNAGEALQTDRRMNAYAIVAILAMGVLGLFQVSCQLVQALVPAAMMPPPHPALRQFYPVFVLFMTAVMDAGFFAWTQSKSMMGVAAMGDILLTQAWPVLGTLLGTDWVAAAAINDGTLPTDFSFAKEWLLWTSKGSSGG